jgi:hypothetical protein
MDFVKPATTKIEKMRFDEGIVYVVPSLRTEDVRVTIWEPKPKEEAPPLQRTFTKEASVFKPWVEDNFLTINECIENDKRYWKVQKICKDKDDYQEILNVMSQNYANLKKLFI